MLSLIEQELSARKRKRATNAEIPGSVVGQLGHRSDSANIKNTRTTSDYHHDDDDAENNDRPPGREGEYCHPCFLQGRCTTRTLTYSFIADEKVAELEKKIANLEAEIEEYKIMLKDPSVSEARKDSLFVTVAALNANIVECRKEKLLLLNKQDEGESMSVRISFR
jgi:uncharacterized small protein (DUF1192 family)